jgi:hypothetical protein
MDGSTARMVYIRKSYKILIGKSEKKNHLGDKSKVEEKISVYR